MVNGWWLTADLISVVGLFFMFLANKEKRIKAFTVFCLSFIFYFLIRVNALVAQFVPLKDSAPIHNEDKYFIFTLIGNIANGMIALVGSVVFVVIVYAGLQWLLAQGNEEKIAKAKKTLIWAILGLIIVFSAYMIVYFVMNNMMEAALSNSSSQ